LGLHFFLAGSKVIRFGGETEAATFLHYVTAVGNQRSPKTLISYALRNYIWEFFRQVNSPFNSNHQPK
jgi:hypothetical protein